MFRRWLSLRRTKYGCGVYVDKNVEVLRYCNRVTLGNNVLLKSGVKLCATQPSAHLSIGENTTVGYNSLIFANSKIEIGSNCLIAPSCYIVDANHSIAGGMLINSQPLECKNVFIGKDVWLGANVIVLPGSEIKDGAVIAAGSVVRGLVPENSVFGGVPAKFLKLRL